MKTTYEDARIPVQIRRSMVFDEICKKAKQNPDEIVHLSRFTQCALGVMYLKDFRRYIAFGGVFEYAQNETEIKEQGISVFSNDEAVVRTLTVNLKQFTKPSTTSTTLLWRWNKFVKNRMHTYIDYRVEHFFRINDEIDEEYAPHKYHDRLVATSRLPMWDDRPELVTEVYKGLNTGKTNSNKFNEKRMT